MMNETDIPPMALDLKNIPAPTWCPDCRHWAEPGHYCNPCCDGTDWQFTTSDEFPVIVEECCVYVGEGDECYCHRCQRLEAEFARRTTEEYWRARIEAERAAGGGDAQVEKMGGLEAEGEVINEPPVPRQSRSPIGTMVEEDDRKPQRDALARAIADSEAFMWLMVGANHPEAHLDPLRRAYQSYTSLDGGYGHWAQRQRPLTEGEKTTMVEFLKSFEAPSQDLES